ncbi:MAG: dephospho-CoA kinase [Bryobacterales bacterium]|nr:dephospho-CoA kinase [Bryobacterales bacterium]
MGLTGGLASGKSFVGETLAELGCHLMKADEVGHRLLEPDGAAYARVVGIFGPAILGDDGRIDRARLGAAVFGNVGLLEKLNQIIHPLVFAEEDQFLNDVATRDPGGIGVVEAAILIETGNYRSFDKILVAWCPPEIQIERSIRRGMSRAEAAARLSHQLPLHQKLALADAVVDTSGSKDATRLQVIEVHKKLQAWAAEQAR